MLECTDPSKIENPMSDKPLPSYEKPPVIEVVLGLTFETLSLVKLPHIGLFWDRIRSEFPRCEQAPTLGDINAVIEPESAVPLPRVWFINRDDDNLIQLQKNKFLFNWRKRESSYPRYGPVSGQFFRYLAAFEQFLSDNDLGSVIPSECECTYINHIPKSIGWELPKDIGSVLPDVNWRQSDGRFLPNPDAVSWGAVFKMPAASGTLFAKLSSAIKLPDKAPIFTLELTAKGAALNKSEDDLREWYGTAREWIVRGFEDLVSEKVQREHWKKI
jgi:uncharacterized protein (TIGR04255 family)